MILFFDIETIWDSQKETIYKEKNIDWDYRDMALLPEYWKIICISCGYEKDWALHLNSFYWNEKLILQNFFEVLENRNIDIICWYNILWFDIPFLFKKWLVNRLKIPSILSTYDIQNWWSKKPRDMKALDLMNVWKSTAFKPSSLDLVCKTLWLESPKQDHSWNDVFMLYQEWKKDELIEYCEWDVKACYEIHKIIKDLV